MNDIGSRRRGAGRANIAHQVTTSGLEKARVTPTQEEKHKESPDGHQSKEDRVVARGKIRKDLRWGTRNLYNPRTGR